MLSHAEKVKIDDVISAMNEEYQARALRNIESDLLFIELERRFEKFNALVEQYMAVVNKYAEMEPNGINAEKFVKEMRRIG